MQHSFVIGAPRLLLVAFLLPLMLLVACGGDIVVQTSPTSDSAESDTTSDTQSEILPPDTQAPPAPDSDIVEGCEGKVVQASKPLIDLVLVMDRTGSMTAGKWTDAAKALNKYAIAERPQGTRVLLSFFPDAGAEQGEECLTELYSASKNPFTPVPESAGTLSQLIDQTTPGGGTTPIYGALVGNLEVARDRQLEFPNHKVVVVLVTDGTPNGCPTKNQNEPSFIADIVASAYDMNGIRTHVIALLGSTLSELDTIAGGGQTEVAYDLTGDTNLLDETLLFVEQDVARCEFVVPPPPEPGTSVDPNKINLWADSDGVPIPQVNDEESCEGNPGWYFINPKAPARVALCPSSCSNDPTVTMSFQIGCDSLTP